MPLSLVTCLEIADGGSSAPWHEGNDANAAKRMLFLSERNSDTGVHPGMLRYLLPLVQLFRNYPSYAPLWDADQMQFPVVCAHKHAVDVNYDTEAAALIHTSLRLVVFLLLAKRVDVRGRSWSRAGRGPWAKCCRVRHVS